MFSKECSKCGSTEHAFEDCPHSFFSEECSKCGSNQHAFEDCPHSFFSKECSKCGSTEHAFEDCPHSFFAKECSKCGSVNHATHDCPQGFFARPPRERERADDSDDDELVGGLIKLGLIVGAVVFIFWLIFNVILPFVAINAAVIALIASFVFKDRKSIILPVSLLSGCFVVFDYNYGLFVRILQSSIESSVSFIKYFVLLNFVAGLVAAYFIGEKIIADRAADSADEETHSRNRSILIGALALVGIGGIGTQYYFDNKYASSTLDSAAAGPLSPDLNGAEVGQTVPDPAMNNNTGEPQAGATNAGGIVGTWELVARQCCGDMIGTDELPWEQVSKAERERVTFYSGGKFVSTSATNPEGKWTVSDGTIEGWYIYLVGVEARGDTLIVAHTPTSSQNAYAEKWQRVPNEALSASGGSTVQASSDTKPGQFIGYSNNDSCFGTVYRKSGCGSMDNLSLGGWGDYYYVFVQFDIDDLPDLANGGRAEIWLWGSAPNDPNLVVEKITQRWSESSLSLINGPASTPLSRAPSIPKNPNWIKIDITGLYKSWKSGAAPNYGIKLTPRRNDQTNGSFASSENENADIRPRLVVMPERSR